MPINELSAKVIGQAIRIHRALGPGLLESVYEVTLAASLQREGVKVARQVPVVIEFEGLKVEGAFRVDLLVDDRLIVEIKAIEKVAKVHHKQVLTYLRLMNQPVGLLLNFSCLTMKEGITRLVNEYRPAH